MRSNLFARLHVEPILNYNKDEMYLSIKTNIQNLLRERSGLDQQFFEAKTGKSIRDLDIAHNYYYLKLRKYETRLYDMKLEINKSHGFFVASIIGFFGDGIYFELETDLYLDFINL